MAHALVWQRAKNHSTCMRSSKIALNMGRNKVASCATATGHTTRDFARSGMHGAIHIRVGSIRLLDALAIPRIVSRMLWRFHSPLARSWIPLGEEEMYDGVGCNVDPKLTSYHCDCLRKRQIRWFCSFAIEDKSPILY